MSGPARPLADAEDPALDAGVLGDGPVCEWHGWRTVARHGGVAVLPWRGDHLAALAINLTTVGTAADVPPGTCAQALVRIQKGRAATCNDLIDAWNLLGQHGRLFITGSNDLGITTWVKRVGDVLGQGGEVLANHSRARVACFHRIERALAFPLTSDRVPLWPSTWEPQLQPQAEIPQIRVPPGVFSHGEVDAGTALLAQQLADESPAHRVLDLGCGAGHLGLHALLRWPQAHAWFLDADVRAVAAVADNLTLLACLSRGTVLWWDVSEALPTKDLDLVLCNPPCHAGTSTDYATAQAMFRHAANALAPGGRLLVVANRHLPYERDLVALGKLEIPVEQGGFKILRLRRSAR